MRISFGGRNTPADITTCGWWFSAALRAAWFSCLWFVLAGAHLGDIPAAIAAVAIATWTSMHLLKPVASRRSLPSIVQLLFFFLYHSIVAGIDVAKRALMPRLPLRPGFVTYTTKLPHGMSRNLFTTLTSLLPGTVPVGEQGYQLFYHCLDIEQPILAELAAVEAALIRALYNA